MTDNPTPEDIAFQADLDRLRAQVGAARLAEAARRGIGQDMLTDALLRVMEANELAERENPMDFWAVGENWGWIDEESNEND